MMGFDLLLLLLAISMGSGLLFVLLVIGLVAWDRDEIARDEYQRRQQDLSV